MRLPQNEDERAEFWTKVLFVVFLFVLFLVPGLLSGKSEGAYSASDTTATASVQQTLRLVILPAIDVQTVGESESWDGSAITKTLNIALRANTAWSVSVDAKSQGFADNPTCQTIGASGERNLDDSAQFFSIACEQPVSWGDAPGVQSLDVSYSVTPPLGN